MNLKTMERMIYHLFMTMKNLMLTMTMDGHLPQDKTLEMNIRTTMLHPVKLSEGRNMNMLKIRKRTMMTMLHPDHNAKLSKGVNVLQNLPQNHLHDRTGKNLHQEKSNHMKPRANNYLTSLKRSSLCTLFNCAKILMKSSRQSKTRWHANLLQQRKRLNEHQAVIVLQDAYHGSTTVTAGMSTCLGAGAKGNTDKAALDWDYCARDVHVAEWGDPEAVLKIARELPEGNNPAAFFAETIQGVGGHRTCPEGYLKTVYDGIRKMGAICVADEVQTGFGRTGDYFWSFEAQAVIPDIVTLGKPVGNGFPLGVVITKRAIAKKFDGCAFFNTCGGNPVACAAGLAVLEVVEREKLQDNAKKVSEYFLKKLHEGPMLQYPDVIKDVQGMGWFLGMRMDSAATADCIVGRCRELKVLVGASGAVVRVKGPVCLTLADVDLFLDALVTAIKEVHERNAAGKH
eukprot:TRINITY_DN66249_c4_g2_i2.p1 TRINITY_DN66249_c4_g2~~TRINITY_DN66249_c4_g2_i2.p1  ORF type:complete len:456 (-),score=42.41 TRINITY_DN66249_c4_g2_i2:17-1384(-)